MPKESKSGGIANLIRSAGHSGRQAEAAINGQTRIHNVLEYIQAPWGLNMKLYPVQRFIVKLYYHMPLDDKLPEDPTKRIKISDMFNTKTLYTFTEVEYLRYLFGEGRCNIGEQDHVRRQLTLPIGRRAGKCVTGDTLVVTNEGIQRLEDISQAPEEEFSSTELGVAQEAGRRATAKAFYNGGVKHTYRLKTRSGYEITGTGNHRVKVMTRSGRVEWGYLDDLKVGDVVAINRSTDLWASKYLDLTPYHNESGTKEVSLPTVLDETLGNFLGYAVGDGTWGDDHAVSLNVEHSETWEHATKLFEKLFGTPRRQMDERTANTGRLEFCSVRARRFLDAIGWKLGTGRYEKMVPWTILKSPRPVVCSFLRGLFETDGSAESGGRHISFSSASFRLAHEVQVLLLNLGIVSNVSPKWNAQTKRHYANLSIKGVQSRKRFAEFVGFDSDKKRLPMLAALEVAQEGKSDTESLPFQYQRLRDWLESIPKKKMGEGWGRSTLREALGNTIKNTGEDLTYSRLRRAIGIAKELSAGSVETAHFEELLRLDYFYDEVATVEEGENQVYDLTVPDGESFVANGMTNHNTTLSAIFASYELYRLICLGNPQAYYGLPNGNRIQIISVATDKDQAGLLFNDVTAHMAKCEVFKPYIANNTLSYVQLRTPYDIERYGPTVRHENGKFSSFNGKASLRVTFKASISKGLRGSGNVVIILDEIAHFQDKGTSSAKDIYDAITPSAAAFSPKDPENSMVPIGPVESRIICISSPLNKAGKFFELYHLGMSRAAGSENMLVIQAPTWEVNPTIESAYYREKYHEDPATFMTEHGALFSDRVRGWIEREQDLTDCIRTDLRPRTFGPPRFPHQMGMDIGLVNGGDGTAIAITHCEGDKIVLDYHESWYAGKTWKEANPHLSTPMVEYAKKLQDEPRLDFDEIANWITVLTKKFYITGCLFDRWQGMGLEQTLHKRGLKQFRSEFFNPDTNSKMYQAVKLMMYDKRLVLYDWPIKRAEQVEGEPLIQGPSHSPLIEELLSLQAQVRTKNQIIVEAPKIKGAHDDMTDALIRAIWLSLERISTHHVTRISTGASPARVGMTMAGYQRNRMRSHGIMTDRLVPRGRPRG